MQITKWCVSLPGDPAWWQAFAGFIQAVFALALFVVTKRYVTLTKAVVQLERQNLRLALYDRREQICTETMGFLANFVKDMKIEFTEIQSFLRDTREAEFLFEADVVDFLRELREKALEHHAKSVTYEKTHNQELLNRVHKLEGWLAETAWAEAKRIFGRYLRLAEDVALEQE
jgi:hypothetical protein